MNELSCQNKMTYELAKIIHDQLEAKTQVATDKLNAVVGPNRGPMGLTPDHIKKSDEYKLAKADFDRAFAAQRKFNAAFSKQYKKEIREERRQRNERLTSAFLSPKG